MSKKLLLNRTCQNCGFFDLYVPAYLEVFDPAKLTGICDRVMGGESYPASHTCIGFQVRPELEEAALTDYVLTKLAHNLEQDEFNLIHRWERFYNLADGLILRGTSDQMLGKILRKVLAL